MKKSIDAPRLEELFRRLVEVYSPSGKEGEVLSCVEEFLVEQGCPYGVQPVGEERYNLVLGRPDAPLLFVGHVDTVDAWDLEAVGPRDLGDGWVAGLGAADMKGGCAAMIEAYLTLRDLGGAEGVGVALVVGEEQEGDGTLAFLREARPGRAVVGEPTGLRLCTGHYGYVEAVISAWGRRAHASVPELGENAAESVLAVLHGLLHESRATGRGGPVLNIRNLETTNPGFAVPERATAWVDVHIPPEYEPGSAVAAIDRVIESRGGGRVEASYPIRQIGHRLAAEDPIVAAFRSAGGRELDVFRSHSDASLFHAAGVPTAVLGPGSLEYAHTEDERVDLSELTVAARLYTDMGLSFGKPPR